METAENFEIKSNLMSNEDIRDLQDLEVGKDLEFFQTHKKTAIITYKNLGFPLNSKLENWKYIPIHKYLPENSTQLSNGFEKKVPTEIFDTLDRKFPFLNFGFYPIILVDGILQTQLFEPAFSKLIRDHHILIKPFNEASSSPYFRKKFQSLAATHQDSFTHFNSAEFLTLLENTHVPMGLFIHIPKDLRVDKPFHIHHYSTKDAKKETNIQTTRMLIGLEKFAQLEIIETFSHHEHSIFLSQVSEIFLDEGARLEHVRYQGLGKENKLIDTDLVQLKSFSSYQSHTYSVSGKLIRNNLQIDLAEPNSEVSLSGYYSIHDHEIMDNHTLVRHQKPHCQSNELYKGVLRGKSLGVFNGKVEVYKDAQKTRAYQQNQSILFDSESSMNSKPELEIFADDVKCSHGSTMGQLDKTALFYLQSRGISEKTANKLLVIAFAQSLISALENKEIKGLIEKVMEEQEDLNP